MRTFPSPTRAPTPCPGENPYHEPFAFEADVVFLSTAALADPERTMRRIAEQGRAQVVVATAGVEGEYLLTGAS